MTTAGWPVDRQVGGAAAFHARPLPEPVARAVWWFEVDRPALVLGSTQADSVVADPLGADVVRRRSGGGAVWLEPGAVTWIDLLVPADDPAWDADVGRAAWWVGEAFARALASLGVGGSIEVHRGGLVRTPWSDRLCFAGLGPGEVVVDGRKVVGISQRRTRAGARFQCAVLHRWDPTPLLDRLAPFATSPEDRTAARAELAPGAPGAPAGLVDLGVDVAPATLVAALVAHLPTR